MGGKRKRPFIDPKKSTKFQLLHRSQKDPLIADESIGQRVLHPVEEDKEERQKYGIYYRDDYEYLQHLKQVGEAVDLVGGEPMLEQEVIHANNPRLRLPSCIFETQGVELKVGMLNQAAPKNELLPDIDQDVMAALNGEVEQTEEDELEDDFVLKADFGDEAPKWENEMLDEKKGREEMMGRFGLRKGDRFSDESSADEDDDDSHEGSEESEEEVNERKSRFTNYSMSSAVIKRPDGLRIIDDHFETLYSEQYAEEQIGEGDEEEKPADALNKPNSERFLAVLDDESGFKKRYPRELPSDELKQSILRYVEATDGGVEHTDRILVPADGAKRGRWDCESILSTYSTLYNHPTEIREFSSGAKREGKGVTRKDLKQLDKMMETDAEATASVRTRTSMASSFRPKGETAEERRARKQAVKEERKERRKEKKTNRIAFRDEKLKLEAQNKNGRLSIRPIH